MRFFIHDLKQIDGFECLNYLSMHLIYDQLISFYISELSVMNLHRANHMSVF